MKLIKMFWMAGLAAALTLSANTLLAQPEDGGPGGGPGGNGGNGGGPGGPGGGRRFDPAQMQERMLQQVREQLEIKDDAEWKAIQPLVTNVMAARMEVGMGGMRGMMGGMRNRDRGNGQQGTNSPARMRGPGGPFGQTNAVADALEKAIESKDAAAVKTKLEAYRADVKAKEAKLAAAQDKLKAVLTPQQEAIAVLNGWLK